jgi:site-specific DNA recombinase
LKSGAKVVGYVRVSTEEQAAAGLSIPMQADKVIRYADLHNLILVAVEVDDGVSARTIRRDGLRRALAKLDSGECEGLVIYRLDRLTRSLRDWSTLIERYFSGRTNALMSVSESIETGSAAGRMVLNMLVTLGQWERETTVERTQNALDHLRSQGRRISGEIPYGKTLCDDGRRSKSGGIVGLVDDPHEQEVLAEIRVMHANGASHSAIAAELEARGVPTRHGGPWGRSTIRRLVECR